MLFGVLRAKLRDKPRVDIEFDAFVEGNLCAQTSRTILNTLEVFVQVLFTILSYLLMKNTIILCHNMIICTDYYQQLSVFFFIFFDVVKGLFFKRFSHSAALVYKVIFFLAYYLKKKSWSEGFVLYLKCIRKTCNLFKFSFVDAHNEFVFFLFTVSSSFI